MILFRRKISIQLRIYDFRGALTDARVFTNEPFNRLKISAFAPTEVELDSIERTTCVIPPNNYEISAFIKAFNECTRAALLQLFEKIKVSPNVMRFQSSDKFFMNQDDSNHVCININPDYNKIINLRIRLQPPLQYQLGYSEYLGYDIGWSSWHVADGVLQWKSKIAIDELKNTLNSMFVFCDICMPTLVNDQLLPLLRMIPMYSDAQLYHESFPLQLIGISRGRISRIKIWFTATLFGPPLAFNDDIFVKLIFECVR